MSDLRSFELIHSIIDVINEELRLDTEIGFNVMEHSLELFKKVDGDIVRKYYLFSQPVSDQHYSTYDDQRIEYAKKTLKIVIIENLLEG